MPTILKGLLSSAVSIFGGLWGYVAVAAVAGSLAGYEAQHLRYNADEVRYQALQLKDAQAVTASLEAQGAALTRVAATQHAVDLEALQGALAEAAAQETIKPRIVTRIQEVTRYVTPHTDTVTVACIPFGFVRVLDAAALDTPGLAVAPSDLALPAGQSDDACAPVKASDLAASIAANYGTAEQNAEQLNALEEWVHNVITKANAQ